MLHSAKRSGVAAGEKRRVAVRVGLNKLQYLSACPIVDMAGGLRGKCGSLWVLA